MTKKTIKRSSFPKPLQKDLKEFWELTTLIFESLKFKLQLQKQGYKNGSKQIILLTLKWKGKTLMISFELTRRPKADNKINFSRSHEKGSVRLPIQHGSGVNCGNYDYAAMAKRININKKLVALIGKFSLKQIFSRWKSELGKSSPFAFWE